MRETDADQTLFARVAVVALARPGDAFSMRHDSGEAAEDIEEGYDIKRGHIEDALQKVGIAGVEAFAYDAGLDDPMQLTSFILDRIAAVRKSQADSGRATIAAIDRMFENLKEQQALAAFELVNKDISRFCRPAPASGFAAPARPRQATVRRT